MSACLFCDGDGGEVLHRDERLRIVLAGESDYPGLLRVVWNRHVREMTDLDAAERTACMQAMCACEGALRAVLQPDKINLASFGNVVPHLHWHVIPRYRDDPHFPASVWGTRQRDTPRAIPADFVSQVQAQLRALF